MALLRRSNEEDKAEIEVWEQRVSEPYPDEVEILAERRDGIHDESRHYSSEEAAAMLDFDVDRD